MEDEVYTVTTQRGGSFVVISHQGICIAIRPAGVEQLVESLRDAVIYNQDRSDPEFKSKFHVKGVMRRSI